MQCDPWSCRRSRPMDLAFFLRDGKNPQWHQHTAAISYVRKTDLRLTSRSTTRPTPKGTTSPMISIHLGLYLWRQFLGQLQRSNLGFPSVKRQLDRRSYGHLVCSKRVLLLSGTQLLLGWNLRCGRWWTVVWSCTMVIESEWCGAVLVVFHRPVGNPKRKVWWAQQQVFPSVRNQGLSNPGKSQYSRRWCWLAY
jgi:hypothetical protein